MPLQADDFEAIRQLYGRYVLALDTADVEGFVACFTRDATWRYSGLPEEVERSTPFVGHEELRRLVTDITSTGGQMLHQVHLQQIDGDRGAARTVHYGEVLRRGQAPHAGIILTDVAEDTLVCIDGEWLFQTRTGYVDSHSRIPAPSDILIQARDEFVDHVLERL